MVGKWHRAFVACLILGACVPSESVRPPQDTFRTASAPFSSTTRVDPARLSGSWRVTSAFASAEGTLPSAHLKLTASAGVLRVEEGGWMLPEGTYFSPTPGRYARQGGPKIWLLWVDDDWRTAALGSPDGRLGWIMERGPQAVDRQKAAREILGWMGFDLSKLRKVAP